MSCRALRCVALPCHALPCHALPCLALPSFYFPLVAGLGWSGLIACGLRRLGFVQFGVGVLLASDAVLLLLNSRAVHRLCRVDWCRD